MSSVKHFRELAVYQGAMSLVMRIFELTKHFPIEERYTLTDQVRRSSRSVCANLAEARRRRRIGVSADGRVGVFVSRRVVASWKRVGGWTWQLASRNV